MTKRLEITEDVLKLIPFINYQRDDDDNITIPLYHMFSLGDHLLEDMAIILGKQDSMIESTKDDADGAAYNDEMENYMLDLHQFFVDNLYYIETLVHQYVTMGGLTVGTYKCNPKDMIWSKES